MEMIYNTMDFALLSIKIHFNISHSRYCNGKIRIKFHFLTLIAIGHLYHSLCTLCLIFLFV